MDSQSHLEVAPDVQAALAARQPVVALESTIISHGMPYPANVETALKVSGAVREAGAVPATVALIDGKLKVGLSESEIEKLGRAGKSVTKCSRRDLAVVLAKRTLGATTVASTMIGAALAGIRVFATGGIGGVHRDAQQTFDISADLQELARTPVAVVCAGAKSILDLGLTLEYLETHGVPVLGYQTDELPAFYTRESGFLVDYRLNTPEEVAAVLHTQWSLGLSAGAVIANPIPEAHAMKREDAERAIAQALGDAKADGKTGKEVTPYLLGRLVELTGRDSLASNIQLILNNARLAADIARALCEVH